MSTEPLQALLKAIQFAGSAAALARAVDPIVQIKGLRCAQQHVSNWLNRDKAVPAGYVLAVAEAVSWQVTPHELRPDIYPNPTDGLPADDPRRTAVKVAA